MLAERNISAVGLIVDALKSDSVATILNGLEIVKYVQDDSLVNPIITLLIHKNYDVRKYAVEALGTLKNEKAIDPICKVLGSDVGDIASEQLVKFDSKRTMNPLINLLKNENPLVRLNAASVLQHNPEKKALTALINSFQNGDIAVTAGSYFLFLDHEGADAEKTLSEAMYAHGDLKMCTLFLNSGRESLENAGREWARQHGFNVDTE